MASTLDRDRTDSGAVAPVEPEVPPGERPGTGSEPATAPTLGSRFRSLSIERRFLLILLVIFLAKGVVYSFIFPPFSGHDEVAHYGYLTFIADEGRPPIIPDLDEWQAEYAEVRTQDIHDHIPESVWPYCRYVTDDWYHGCREDRFEDRPVYAINFDGATLPSGWVYTANHPPLYYLVMTPIYWLSDGASVETQLYLLRLAAIPFGMLTVLFAFMATRVIFPGDRFLAIVVPSFVAFQPQISYEAAMLNNDILSIAFTSIVFYFLALGLRRHFSWRICVITGFFLGLAMLSKNTSAVSGAVIAVAMILGLGVRNWKEWLPKGAVTAGVAGLIIWPWYLYMWVTYGNFTALDRIQDLQYWNYQGAERPTIWSQLTNPDFAWMRWRETWGEWGWRLIPLDTNLLWVIFWFCVVGLVGLGWWAVQSRLARSSRTISFRSESGGLALPSIQTVDDGNDEGNESHVRRIDPIFRLDRPAKIAVVTLLFACVLAYYAILQFGLTFSLTQARYYFPSVNAAAILILLGYRAILPRRWQPYSYVTIFFVFVILNVVIFSQYIIPYWNADM